MPQSLQSGGTHWLSAPQAPQTAQTDVCVPESNGRENAKCIGKLVEGDDLGMLVTSETTRSQWPECAVALLK